MDLGLEFRCEDGWIREGLHPLIDGDQAAFLVDGNIQQASRGDSEDTVFDRVRDVCRCVGSAEMLIDEALYARQDQALNVGSHLLGSLRGFRKPKVFRGRMASLCYDVIRIYPKISQTFFTFL